MTASECARVAKAYDMLSDWIGAELVLWPGEGFSELWDDAACILQQLIAEYEGWV